MRLGLLCAYGCYALRAVMRLWLLCAYGCYALRAVGLPATLTSAKK